MHVSNNPRPQTGETETALISFVLTDAEVQHLSRLVGNDVVRSRLQKILDSLPKCPHGIRYAPGCAPGAAPTFWVCSDCEAVAVKKGVADILALASAGGEAE